MKRLEDYTREELVNITDEEKELLIELEAMCEGVEIPEEPRYLDMQEVDAPDIEVYEIECDKLYYKSKEEAEKVVSFLNSTEMCLLDYKYEYGYDRKFVKTSDQLISAKVVKAYSKDIYFNIGKLFKVNKTAEETNNRLRSDYNDAIKGYNEIRANVQRAIDDAIYKQQTETRYRQVYTRYVELANGDEEVAQKFFRQTYQSIDDETAERIFADMRGEE